MIFRDIYWNIHEVTYVSVSNNQVGVGRMNQFVD